MEIVEHPDAWRRPKHEHSANLEQRVQNIVARIRDHGEEALRIISHEIDGFLPEVVELRPWTSYGLDAAFSRHLKKAARRIEAFAKRQRSSMKDINFKDKQGRYGHKWVPLDRMGAYIPAGRYPLISTALMTLIPARIAGVQTRVAVSPSAHPALLAAASLAGATRMVRVGGAQAVAALAFGTESVPRVDMIAGPGNAYVNEAKRLVQANVKIDTLAGPSELLVLSDGSIEPNWIAMDLLAQGEHDPMALAICASTDRQHLEKIASIIRAELGQEPEGKGDFQFVHCEDREQCIDFANDVAAEHLALTWQDPESDQHQLRHYGSLFMGPYSAVALGDYCSGPNHTLPTLGVVRMKGGLFVGDFLRALTWQKIEASGFEDLSKTAKALAQAEGLDYHYRSLAVRDKTED